MNLKDRASDRRHGIMFGLAYGDALGRPTEFMSAKTLAKFGSPFTKRVGLNRPGQGIVTDDTQMSIAVARAALVHGRPIPGPQASRFVGEFIRWSNDPKSRDGQRAPGMTCLSSVGALKKDPLRWINATATDSKGNGANMRVSPLALRTDWSWDELAATAQLQAAITHGHPTALAAANLTAVAVRMLMEGIATPTENLIDHLIAYAYDQRMTYHTDWLGHLWQTGRRRPPPVVRPMTDLVRAARLNWWDDADGLLPTESFQPAKATRKPRPAPKSPQAFIQRGWDRMITVLEGVADAPRDREQDPCEVGGEGWIAEEALVVSLHTLLCFPDDPTNALRRAAFTSGDSDSIGSITGALAGAAYGLKAFPSHWIGNLEYRHQLEDLTVELTAAAR